jgi:hypothetical protein
LRIFRHAPRFAQQMERKTHPSDTKNEKPLLTP